MNKKKIRHAFNHVVSVAEDATCESLHHTNSQKHEHDEVCKAYCELSRQIHILREYMKDNGIF